MSTERDHSAIAYFRGDNNNHHRRGCDVNIYSPLLVKFLILRGAAGNGIHTYFAAAATFKPNQCLLK